MAVHITDESEPAEKKFKVYFQCLLHASKMILRYRSILPPVANVSSSYDCTIFHTGEWISGPVCMYIARYFANPPSDEVIFHGCS